jgi:two-component system phosphate regulon sensor histidine kinase PhoR
MNELSHHLLAAVETEPPILWVVLALIVGLATGAATMMVWVVRRRWEVPVRMIARTANDMAAGKWDVRSVVEGPAEIELLSNRLNSLAEEAQVRFKSLREQSANLKSLVDALPDPVLLADEQDRILLINAPAERLLQLPPQQVIGKPFLTAVSDPSILDIFETFRRQRDGGSMRPIDREIRLVRRGHRLSFQAHVEPTPNNGLLVVLRDVSTLAATIQMKTDFVANASHELRTPISAIKVAFETLRDVYPQDNQLTTRCITIIDGHLRRLEEMLRDLLDLSRVENADLKPHLATVRTFDLMAMLRSTWLPIASEKGVELVLPEPSESIEFTSDRRLLDLILKNLVENAIKFTPPGGRVVVNFARRESEGRLDVLLSVADTGCGIPDEHKERVFERFYQVDSARSGAAGRGTGLGLAIVKHAVNAMAGQLQLQSKMGSGTMITCILPILEASSFLGSEA